MGSARSIPSHTGTRGGARGVALAWVAALAPALAASGEIGIVMRPREFAPTAERPGAERPNPAWPASQPLIPWAPDATPPMTPPPERDPREISGGASEGEQGSDGGVREPRAGEPAMVVLRPMRVLVTLGEAGVEPPRSPLREASGVGALALIVFIVLAARRRG